LRAGVAALVYGGTGRRFVLGLKHGDRTDLAPVAGRWLARAAAALIRPDTVIAPVPLHRLRLLHRRYNQSALLARALALQTGAPFCPDLLDRPRATPALEGTDRDTRFARLDGAIRVTPRHAAGLAGRHVLIVDDVMTSGATLEAATRACQVAGSGPVSIAVLARALPGSGGGTGGRSSQSRL
jgi:predicted amidophosphoribosyltransferase